MYVATSFHSIFSLNFVDDLKIKWCTEFKLLGIYFDVTLSKMQIKYEKAVESVKRELYSWKHRFLTIFGKITVIKQCSYLS